MDGSLNSFLLNIKLIKILLEIKGFLPLLITLLVVFLCFSNLGVNRQVSNPEEFEKKVKPIIKIPSTDEAKMSYEIFGTHYQDGTQEQFVTFFKFASKTIPEARVVTLLLCVLFTYLSQLSIIYEKSQEILRISEDMAAILINSLFSVAILSVIFFAKQFTFLFGL